MIFQQIFSEQCGYAMRTSDLNHQQCDLARHRLLDIASVHCTVAIVARPICHGDCDV